MRYHYSAAKMMKMETIDINKGWQDVECVGEISSNILKNWKLFLKKLEVCYKVKMHFYMAQKYHSLVLPKRNRNIFHVSNLTASAFINN